MNNNLETREHLALIGAICLLLRDLSEEDIAFGFGDTKGFSRCVITEKVIVSLIGPENKKQLLIGQLGITEANSVSELFENDMIIDKAVEALDATIDPLQKQLSSNHA